MKSPTLNCLFALGLVVSSTAVWAAKHHRAAGQTEPAGKESVSKVTASEAQSALDQMVSTDPEVRKALDTAVAYAVFPSVGKAAVGVGGAYGKGVVYKGNQVIGYAELKQGSVGVQAGGETYSELLVFKDQAALE
jgi:lipid-binding SYLF domain-containing protein